MAWRLEEFLIRGDLDNRVRGRVTGRLWFVGRPEPVELDLAGDAWRDLAGRRLVFTHARPKPALPAGFAGRQTGVVGDITASRKVKVPDIPLEQIGEYYAARKPFPWHWGNSLYLEWFSEVNGRVVIESADYELTIAGDATWEMTPAEEEAQRRANGEAIVRFMERLGDTAAATEDREFAADDDRPQTEAEADRMLEESERLVDRIQARLEREGPDADYERILEEELERRRRERGEAPPTPEEEARRAEWLEELSRAEAEAPANDQPDAEAERKHPLAERAFELAVRLHRNVKEHGWQPDDASREHPVVELVVGVSAASAKLAGALNGEDDPPPVEICGQVIARLKRAAGYFADARLGAEACAEQHLVDPTWLADVDREVADLAAETDRIIGELRERLKQGFD